MVALSYIAVLLLFDRTETTQHSTHSPTYFSLSELCRLTKGTKKDYIGYTGFGLQLYSIFLAQDTGKITLAKLHWQDYTGISGSQAKETLAKGYW